MGKCVLKRVVQAGFGNAGKHAQRVVALRRSGVGAARLARHPNPCDREAVVDDARRAQVAARILAPTDGHSDRLERRNLDGGSQLVHEETLHQRVALANGGVQHEAVAVAPDEEIEQDLALRCQKRAGKGLALRQGGDVGGHQIVEEMLGIGTGHLYQGAVGQGGFWHRRSLPDGRCPRVRASHRKRESIPGG